MKSNLNWTKKLEGQLPKGAAYLDNTKQGERTNRLGQPPPPQQQLYRSPYEQGKKMAVFVIELGVDCLLTWESVYTIQREYNVASTSSAASLDQNSSQQREQERKIVDLTANKLSGVGPVSQEGVPVALRSVYIYLFCLFYSFFYYYYLLKSASRHTDKSIV